ncbi:DUF389 domain-containing protein [Actinopolyspora mzabensis]|uniref:DUF389 domain-containing protein n=1 Tax=Actinopolyspora mzabensis TaxID=995066 RepID=UPI000B84B739|nr:DUF389 domain-containing protein [Actinopolyspora mzabensis]
MIWDELVAITGEESRLDGIFLAFLTLACLLAAVGVLTDSASTTVGAMVVSPDFGPPAALAVATVGSRRDLVSRAGVALGLGYPVSILVTVVLAILGREVGIFDLGELGGYARRPSSTTSSPTRSSSHCWPEPRACSR